MLIFNDGHDQEKVCTSASLSTYRNCIVTEQFKRDFRRNVGLAHRPEGIERTGTSSPILLSDTSADYLVANTSFGSNSPIYGDFERDSGRDTRKYSSSSSSGRRYHQQRRSSDESDEEGSSFSRKRPRFPRGSHQGSIEEQAVPIRKTQSVRVDDEEELEKLYNVRFKDMHQNACKIMGKAFVKLVEPKKQTHHPYTKGNEHAPDWWPSTTGENAIRHKEPDHLLKNGRFLFAQQLQHANTGPERTRLLVHILKMAITPQDKQIPSVQKSNLSVDKLEEVTWEAMTTFFNDREKPGNAEKKGYLKEIFKVAKMEQSYRRGEIDGTTKIPIMYGDKVSVEASDDEDEEEAILTPMTTSPVSPSLVQGSHAHHIQHQQQLHDQLDVQQRQSTSLVVRGQHPNARHVQDSFAEPFNFGRGMDVNFQHAASPSLGDPSRRGYYNAPTLQQSWQQPMMGNGNSSENNYYVSPPQSNLPPLSQTALNPAYLPMPAPQQMQPPQLPQHHSQFDRDFSQGNPVSHPLRTASLPTFMPPQNGFEGYMNDGNGYVQQHEDMKEEHQHVGHSSNH